MTLIIAVNDARLRRHAPPIHIDPRVATLPGREPHRATLPNETRSVMCIARFVAIEHSINHGPSHAIHIAYDPLTAAQPWAKPRIASEVVQAPARPRRSQVASDTVQPASHGDVDERPQRAVDQQQRIALREP